MRRLRYGLIPLNYVRTLILAAAVPLVGCDLGFVSSVYNLTSCPIQVKVVTTLQDASGERGPFVISSGNAVSAFNREPIRYNQIAIIDGRNIEHRYDGTALAAFRHSNSNIDRWAYTESGLVFLDRNPERAELEQIASSRVARDNSMCGNPGSPLSRGRRTNLAGLLLKASPRKRFEA